MIRPLSILPALLALTLAGSAFSDTPPADGKRPFRGDPASGTLCDAQAGTGDCTSGGEEVVLDTAGMQYVTVDLSESVGSFTCTVEGNNVGHDAASGTGQTLHSPALSSSALAVTLTAPPRFIWVNCTVNPTTVTARYVGRLAR